MMPVIRITDEVFTRLQRHATPFVDTPATVIDKLLDYYEAGHGAAPPTASQPTAPVASPFDPEDPPDLTHTRVIAAEFDGRSARYWNELVDVAHLQAMAKLKSFEELRKATRSHLAKGHFRDSGFHYLPDINVSIQGIDSDLAWRNALHLARRISAPIRVEFEWRQKAGAAHPGKRGYMEWTPKK